LPDKIDSKAIAGREQQYGISACGDANVHGKRTCMETGQVDASVLFSVTVTKSI
jgi:uncharacterized membrane protein